MEVFTLAAEESWNPAKHVEKILSKVAGGDAAVACWEAGQISPYHCHPHATEIYYCVEGGGKMRTPERTVDIVPGGFVVHPPGELHEYINGPQRTVLFRVRYGTTMKSRHMYWQGHPERTQLPEDAEFFAQNPALVTAEVK
jgi:quercetin dioxygenase-like cupin family protein